MVLGVRNIHTVMYPFFVFTAVEIAPLVLGPSIRARRGLPGINKFACRRTGRVARLCGRSLGQTSSRVDGDLRILLTFLFQGHGQSNKNLVVIGILVVSFSGRLVVCA